MADNLKLKAEELIQRRVNKERRKHTEDFKLEKLTINKCDDSDESQENPTTQPDIQPSYKKKAMHKESMAKPLGDDSEDESAISRKCSPNKYYKDMRVSDNISRLMDEKRSTIKEQIEDEEEFTGSSLNISQTLQFIRSSKHCNKQRGSIASKTSPNKESEPCSKTSKRKNSDPYFKCESNPTIDLAEKPRKFTDTFKEIDGFKNYKMKAMDNDNRTTTIGGTTVIAPFFQS